MTRQMDSLAAGSCGMDIEADCFAPATDEWTTDRGAVRQQQWLAARAHAQRRSVIFSWHPGRKLSLSEARRRAQQLRDRGADFVKIVETVASDEAALDTVRISLALRRELNFPFVFLALGEAALQFRPFMTHFGAAYLLARPAGGENRIGAQPLVAPARTIVDLR
jgi:hypothetical protein